MAVPKRKTSPSRRGMRRSKADKLFDSVAPRLHGVAEPSRFVF